MLITDRLLKEVNRSVSGHGHALGVLAKDHKLFLGRRTGFYIARLSLLELSELLVVIKDLLDTLWRHNKSQTGVRTLCEGSELLDSTLDELYIANLEHLLLCLQDQVIRLLVTKCIEDAHRHVIEYQKDQSRHTEEWFFEYPDVRHPESTTWPWSLKPSLAVLWGVCWMFYDFDLPQGYIDASTLR